MQALVTWFTVNKRDLQTMLAAVAMLLILVYTAWHTAALLGSYVTPAPIGWIAALGIEAAVVALSLRAGAYKRTLAAALVVSAIANLEQGARENGLAQSGLTVDSIQRIDPLQAVIGIAATALLSILVFRLADIVSHDAQGQPQERAHEAQPATAEQQQSVSQPANPAIAPGKPGISATAEQPQERTTCAYCDKDYATPNALRAHEWRCPKRTTAAVPQVSVVSNGHKAA